ncbi:MAG: hypothetical protein M0Z46_04865 [Actinomycetota bacterium]|nr:hypothetical protein [Actinomycetota bacterium]
MGIARFAIGVRQPFRLDPTIWAQRLDVGIRLLDRLATACGLKVEEHGANAGFPTPELLAAAPEELRRLGLSSAKAQTLTGPARRVVSGTQEPDNPTELDDEQEAAALAERWWPYGGMVHFHLLLDGLGRAGRLEAVACDLQSQAGWIFEVLRFGTATAEIHAHLEAGTADDRPMQP